jgi:ribonuclease HII
VSRVIIGVDEAGTGAWAGPYFVCAAAAYEHDASDLRRVGGRDSKRVSSIRRKGSIAAISDVLLFACSIEVPVAEIDARKKDAWRSAVVHVTLLVVELLLSRGIESPSIDILIDGLPDTRTKNWIRSNSGIDARFLTQAEDQVPVVGAASVIAKTERDLCMKSLHEKYPQYGWNRNYGYGTKQHADALVLYGRSQQHRDINVGVLRKEET